MTLLHILCLHADDSCGHRRSYCKDACMSEHNVLGKLILHIKKLPLPQNMNMKSINMRFIWLNNMEVSSIQHSDIIHVTSDSVQQFLRSSRTDIDVKSNFTGWWRCSHFFSFWLPFTAASYTSSPREWITLWHVGTYTWNWNEADTHRQILWLTPTISPDNASNCNSLPSHPTPRTLPQPQSLLCIRFQCDYMRRLAI